jgi:predicted ATPase/DNA-binding SARP family transcriptional activator/pimeloyl-ACP methyl ester carboxylesterase/Tfp pilus assembly protein PilF
MISLRISLFGVPHIARDGEKISIRRRKSMALLAYLAVSGQSHSRDSLATLLWPDNDQSSARANLRRDLSRLKKHLGEEILLIDRTQVGFNPQGEYWLDVAEFKRLVENARQHGHILSDREPVQPCENCIEALSEAVEIYRDDFMAGFSLPDSAAFDEWQFFQAEGLKQYFSEALQALIAWYAGNGEYAQGIKYGRRWLALDSLHEPAHRQLMLLFAMAGQHAAALRQYQECVRLLAEEIGVEPEEETSELYEAIRTKQIGPPTSEGEALSLLPHAHQPETRPSTPETTSIQAASPTIQQEIQFYESRDGTRIAYATVGEGPVLVKAANWLSHLEFDWESPVWRHWLRALSAHHTLVRYDERGSGLSDWDVDELSIDVFVEDLEAVVEAMGLERFALLGLSQGGPVAIAYAVKHPGKVSHLILYGTYARGRFNRSDSPQELELGETILRMMEIGWGQDNPAFRQFFTSLFMPDATAEQMHWFNDLQKASTSAENAVLLEYSFFHIDVSKLVPQLKVPTLVLHATEDGIVPFEEGRHLAALLPNASMVPLESRNHILLDDEPAWERFIQEVYRFLEVGPNQQVQSISGHHPVNLYPSEARTPRQLIVPPSKSGSQAGREAEAQLEDQPAGSQKVPFVESGAKRDIPNNLPSPATPFIGRDQEIQALQRLLIQEPACRLLTLFGPGGSGKTRLAVEAASLWLPAFPDGVFFVPLASVSAVEFIVSAIAEALHFGLSRSGEAKTQLLSYLKNKKLLLVVDNFEHLLDGAALLSEILDAAPQIKLLVTSRERLHLQEEWNYEVHGLSYPQESRTGLESDPEELLAFSAVQLFVQRARQANPEFDLTQAEVRPVIQICRLVAGLPLGLELAATWVRSMTCQEIAAEIQRSFDFLTDADSSSPARQRSFRAIFEQSWRRLSAEEQAVLRKMSVFHGGCSRQAAEAVSGASLEQLSSLVEKALLHRDQDGRYEMHAMVQQFAGEQLGEPERAQVHALHGDFYLTFLQGHNRDLKGRRQKQALNRIAKDIDNVRAAWQWAVQSKSIQALERSAESFWLFNEYRGQLNEGKAPFAQAVEALAPDGPTGAAGAQPEQATLVGFLMAALGSLTARHGEFPRGKALMEEGISLQQQAEEVDSQKEAFSIAWLAFALVLQGRYVEATHKARQSLALFPQTGDRWVKAGCLRLLGAAALIGGQLEQAENYLRDCLVACEEIGEHRIRTFAIENLASIAISRGDYEQADRLLDQALKFSDELDDPLSRADLLRERGRLDVLIGEYERAVQDLEQSLEIYQEIGRSDVAAALGYLGTAFRHMGDDRQAERAYRQSLEASKAIRHRPDIARSLKLVGFLAYERDNYLLAEKYFQESLEAWRQIDHLPEQASLLRYLGHVATALGGDRLLEARRFYRQSLELAIAHNLAPVAMDVFLGVAGLLDDIGEYRQAAELLSLCEHHPASKYATREAARKSLSQIEAAQVEQAQSLTATGVPTLEWQPTAQSLAAQLSDPDWGKRREALIHLPAEFTPFIGRKREVTSIVDLFNTPGVRLVTVVGFGGIGKTRLASAVAARLAEQLPAWCSAGVVFVSLVGVDSADSLPTSLAKALGVTLAGQGDALSEVSKFLGVQPMLIVLDNFEQLLEGVHLINHLLDSNPGLRLLVTSREALRLAAEWRFDLEGLEYPIGEMVGIEDEHYDAVQLFLQTARQVQADFTPTPTMLASVRRICQLVAGIPLAIKLAASWLQVMPVELIADEISSSMDILTSRMRDIPARQRSMRAVFEYTWGLLLPEEQQVFQALSVFRGGFSRQAGEQVAGAFPYLLAGLLDRGLVQSTGEERYEIQELTRQFAARKLDAQPEIKTQVAQAHCRYFAAFMKQQETEIQHGKQATRVLVEIDNIRAGWQYAVAQRLIEVLEQYHWGLAIFFWMEGWFEESYETFNSAVKALRADSDDRRGQVLQVHLLTHCSAHRQFQGKYEQAGEILEQAFELAQRLGQKNLTASVLDRRTRLANELGDHEEALALGQEALDLYESIGDRTNAARILAHLGAVNFFRQDYPLARQQLQAGVDQFRKLNLTTELMISLNNLALVSIKQGDYEKAQGYLEELIELTGEMQTPVHTTALNSLGLVAEAQGDYERAREHYQQSLNYCRQVGNESRSATPIGFLGNLDRLQGDYRSAERRLQHSLDINRKFDRQRQVARDLYMLGMIAEEREDFISARQKYQRSLAIYEEIDNREGMALALDGIGRVACAFDDFGTAVDYLQRGLQFAMAIGAPSTVDQIFLDWGQCLLSMGENAQALFLLAFVTQHPAAWHDVRRRAQELLDESARLVSPEELAETRKRARKSTIDEVVSGSLAVDV